MSSTVCSIRVNIVVKHNVFVAIYTVGVLAIIIGGYRPNLLVPLGTVCYHYN